MVVLASSTALIRDARAQDAPLKPGLAESPTIKILKGLTVPEFEQEMQGFVQALGVNGCNFCHVRNNFPADTNERKVTARRMIEMTKLINQQFFPDPRPGRGGIEARQGHVHDLSSGKREA